jgi:tetratricopeptide (TPR) repeat protein
LRVRGAHHERARRFAEAAVDFGAAYAIDKSPGTLLARARCLRASGDEAGALVEARRAVAAAPGSSSAHVLVGSLLVKVDATAAEKSFDEAIRLAPDNAEARAMRGQLRASQGRRAEALVDMDRAVELAPRHTAYRGMRGLLRRDGGDDDGAIADFREVVRIDDASWRARLEGR